MKKQLSISLMAVMLVLQVIISGFFMPSNAMAVESTPLTEDSTVASDEVPTDSSEDEQGSAVDEAIKPSTKDDIEKESAASEEASEEQQSTEKQQAQADEKVVDKKEKQVKEVEAPEAQKEQKEQEEIASEEKAIVPNSIVNSVEMSIDGKKVEANQTVKAEVGQAFKLKYSLAIPINTFKKGDTYTIDLPANFNADGIEGGKINELGSYVVKGQQIVITFSEEVENENGTLTIGDTDYLEAGIILNSELQANETNELLQTVVVTTMEGEESFTLQFSPKNVNDNLEKTGIVGKLKTDGTLNTASKNPDTIQWTVTFNKNKAALNNAIFTDSFDTSKLTLQEGTFKATELIVGLDGTITEGGDVTADFTKQADHSWKVKEGSTKAYKITYATTIKDTTATSYTNSASIKADGLNKTSSKTINVSRQPFIYKAGSATKTGAKWTVNYNYSLEELNDAEITDTLGDAQAFNKDSLVIYPVTFDDNGNAVVGKTAIAKSLYDVTFTDNKMVVKFNETVNTAYQLHYTSTLVDQTVDQNRATLNTVTSNGATSAATITNKPNTLTKSSSEVDFQARTAKWTIVVNSDNYDMKNAMINDVFTYKNMHYIEGSATVDGAAFTPTVNEDGLTFNLGDINKKTTITYKTKLDTTTDENFVNKAALTWNGKYTSNTQSVLEIPSLIKMDGYKNVAKEWNESLENYVFHWYVGFNLDLKGVKANTTIKDTFTSKNMTFQPKSLKIIELNMKTGKVQSTNNELSKDYYEVVENEDGNGFVVTFTKDLPEEKAYEMQYDTVDSDKVFEQTYTNVARSTIYGKDGKEDQFTRSTDVFNGGKGIEKSGNQIGKTRTFEYKLAINKSKSILPNVVITDSLTSTSASAQDMQYILDSFKLVEAGTTSQVPLVLTTNENQVADSNTYLYVDQATGKYKVIFPLTINKEYELSYNVYFEGDKGVAFTNNAKLNFKGQESSLVTTSSKTVTYVNNSSTEGWGTVVYKDLFIKKVDAKTGKPLQNAKFDLYKTDDTTSVYRTGTTDENGIVKFSNVRLKDEGTSPYIVKEVEAPLHYEVAPDYKKGKEVQFKKDNSASEGAFVVENEHEACELTITFKNANDKTEVSANGTYDVYVEKEGEKVPYKDLEVQFTDGKASIQLPPGEYFLKQDGKINGYTSENDFTEINVTYDEDGSCSTEIAVVELVPVCDTVIFNVDQDSEQVIKENAEFTLLHDGKEVKTVTSKNGEIDLGQLPSGSYELKQNTAPTGYDLNEAVLSFTVDAENCQTTLPNFENEVPKCDVTIINKNEDGEIITEQSTYDVYKVVEGEKVKVNEEPITGKTGELTIPKLPAGDYELVQTAVEGNYKLNEEPVKFTVNPEQCEAVIIVNDFGTCDVTIINKDGDTGEVITTGSTYTLYKKDAEGNKVEIVVEGGIQADDNGEIKLPSLERGDYVLEQKTAPEHYDTAKELAFTVNAKDCQATTDLVVENIMTYCPATIILIDEELAAGIEGAEFVIKDVDGNVVGNQVTFDKEGKIITEPLRPGTYTFELVKPVAGYDIQTSTTFVIDAEQCGGTIEVNIVNTPNKCDVTIINKDKEGNVIVENSTYKVEKINEDGTTTIVSEEVKAADGKIILEKLRPGNYQITQTTTPEGYVANEEPLKFEVLKDNCLPELTVENEKIVEELPPTESEKPETSVDPEQSEKPETSVDPEQSEKPETPVDPEESVSTEDEKTTVDEKDTDLPETTINHNKPEVEYEVVDQDTGKTVEKAKSNEKGQLKVEELPEGAYKVVSKDDGSSKSITVDNKGQVLPQTGESNSLLYSLIGLLALVGGAYAIMRNRRQQA